MTLKAVCLPCNNKREDSVWKPLPPYKIRQMKKMKTANRRTNVVVDVICDSCGKSCKVYITADKRAFNFQYMTLEATWGYGSDKDTEKWSADICEKCVDKKFKFIKFKKEDCDIWTGVPLNTKQYKSAGIRN